MLETLGSKWKVLDYLVDTGSEVSLVKLKTVDVSHLVKEVCQLSGIGETKVYTLGYVELVVCVAEEKFPHRFHVVEDSFPIDTDEIMGIDFIEDHEINIFASEKLLKTRNYKVKLSLRYEDKHLVFQVKRGKMVIPARSIFKVKVKCGTDEVG
jgi:hypothetical protein